MSFAAGGLQSGGSTAGVAITPSMVTVNPGTAAAPSVNFAGDTTTGIYRSGAGVMAFASAGVQSLLFGPGGVLQNSAAFLLLSGVTGAQLAWNSAASSITFNAADCTIQTPTSLTIKSGGVSLGGMTALGSVRSGAVTIPDASGTPGNATQNVPRGRAAFAAAAATCVITNSEVTADSVVMVILETATDATLLYVRGVAPIAGSFTVTANAAATGTVIFRWFIVK